ncbi:efflux RND transporter periplasmic adaptor subunit [Billgrantia endophytica]|nr:efflux RND transporter periplasmic adaptor subunit [Halomonas endophytica]
MRFRCLPLVMVMLWLAGCETETDAKEPLRPVRTLLLEEVGRDAERRIPGRLEASANRRLSFRVAGRLADLHVSIGDAVESGQRLASLDDTDLALQRDRARAGLAGANAAAVNAEAEWQRARRLYEAGSIPARDLDGARAQVEAARAQRNSAADALALAERQVGFAHLESPGECRVAQRLVESGENLSAGQPALVLACGEGMEVRASLSEDMLGGVEQGDPITVHLPLHDLRLEGRVREIGLPVDARQATWPLRVSLGAFDEPWQAMLRPGMAAELVLPRAQAVEGGIWVPMAAVQRDGRSTFVYVAEPREDEADANGREARIRRIDIELGDRRGEELEIREGLEPGMALVVAGMSRLQDGQAVRLLETHGEASQ